MRTPNARATPRKKESAPVRGKSERAIAERNRKAIISPFHQELIFGAAILAAFLIIPQILGQCYMAGIL